MEHDKLSWKDTGDGQHSIPSQRWCLCFPIKKSFMILIFFHQNRIVVIRCYRKLRRKESQFFSSHHTPPKWIQSRIFFIPWKRHIVNFGISHKQKKTSFPKSKESSHRINLLTYPLTYPTQGALFNLLWTGRIFRTLSSDTHFTPLTLVIKFSTSIQFKNEKHLTYCLLMDREAKIRDWFEMYGK